VPAVGLELGADGADCLLSGSPLQPAVRLGGVNAVKREHQADRGELDDDEWEAAKAKDNPGHCGYRQKAGPEQDWP
jgi:hypothetical protein